MEVQLLEHGNVLPDGRQQNQVVKALSHAWVQVGSEDIDCLIHCRGRPREWACQSK